MTKKENMKIKLNIQEVLYTWKKWLDYVQGYLDKHYMAPLKEQEKIEIATILNKQVDRFVETNGIVGDLDNMGDLALSVAFRLRKLHINNEFKTFQN